MIPKSGHRFSDKIMQKREIDIIDMMCPQDIGNRLRLLVRHAGAIIGVPGVKRYAEAAGTEL
jgi:hypothetical protein